MSTAIISMRANPPHLGHLLTLFRIKDEYDKIIIAITPSTHGGTKSSVMPINEIMDVFTEIFERNFDDKYQVVYSKTDFSTRTKFDDLPKFDVIVTGNKKSFEHMKSIGQNVVWQPRIPGYCGTYIREAYLKELKHGDRD